MARESEEKRVERTLQRIEDDIKWRNQNAESQHWDRWEDYYRGRFSGDGIVPVNVFFPFIRGTVFQTYFRNPSVHVTSHFPPADVKSKIVEQLDKWFIISLGLKGEVRLGGQDTFQCGTGAILHGYDSEWEISGEQMTGPSITNDGKITEYDSLIHAGMPWSRRIHPSNFLLPWGSDRLRDLRRFTVRSRRLLDDVKADDRYRKSVTKDISETKLELITDEGATEPIKTSEKWVYLYRVYDRRDGMVRVVVKGVKKFLFEGPDVLSYVMGDVPATFLVWNLNSRSAWGVPDAKIAESTQKEALRTSTLASRARAINIPKWLYNKEVINEEEAEKWISEEVGAGIGIDGPVNDEVLREIRAHGEPYLAAELERIVQQGRQQVGISETRGGSYTHATKRVTAAEVQSVDFGSDIMSGGRRDVISDAIIDTVKKWNRLIFHFWDEPMWIRAPNIDPHYEYIVFKGVDLRSQYEYKIDSEELAPPDTQSLKEEAAILGPKLIEAATQIQGIDATMVLHEVLRRFPGWDIPQILPGLQTSKNGGGVAMLDPSGVLVPMRRKG